MYNEGQKIKNLNALVSSRDVTEYRSKISQFEDEDKNLFDGVCDLAKNLEVADHLKQVHENRFWCLFIAPGRCDQNWAFHSLALLNLAVVIELRLIWAALNLAYHNSALA